IESWIDQGADYKKHWSFEPPVRTARPAVQHQAWPKTELDYFVLARLEREGMRPSQQADPYTLIRRVALDLTGLPPDPKTAGAFARDPSDAAYERIVDQLLASPHYGERWARMWLDVARYADSQGYEKDNLRSIWPYRDWVIRAFNDNISFDRFTVLQLAGDLLPNPSEADLIATGFHRNTMTNAEGGTDDEEFRDVAIKDRVATTGQVWMGLTWGCAQCHTHKYDPISHKEFYQLYAFFNQSEDSDKEDDRPFLKLASGSTLIMKELPAERLRVTHLQERGNFLTPGMVVQPGVPEAFPPLPPEAPANRLGLARWITDKRNPLTARVTVNRFWARLFGRGIVDTEEDFGTQGNLPSHPELLDWLATEFMQRDWDMKALLKIIVMSATYRQASDITPSAFERDPRNTLLARGPRFRLDAEMVRDQMLAASGLLSPKIGGPPVMPWQPEGIWSVIYSADRWITSPGEDRYRRGLYTFQRRTSPYPSMIAYDAPSGDVCTLRRIRTNTPLQALASLNDPVAMETAQQLALRTLSESGRSAREIAQRMFGLVLVRPPQPPEIDRLLALHRDAKAGLAGPAGGAQKLLHYQEAIYADDRAVTIVADGRAKAPAWKYTSQNPGDAWRVHAFDDSHWTTAAGPFGSFTKDPGKRKPAVAWDAEQLWLRLEFDIPPEKLEDHRLVIDSLGLFEAYVNGKLAASFTLDRKDYLEYKLSREAASTLRPGKNLLAIHTTRVRDAGAGQIFDAGLIASRPLDLPPAHAKDIEKAAWVVVANALLNLDETVTRR
ncbi:MAG: DUF1549 and DUF1553 domain-containing protein, partial [Acidobacteriota bacterium]